MKGPHPILLLLAYFFAGNACADSWTKKADFPGAGREVPFSFVIGDKGYLGCGFVGPFTFLKDFWEYDAAANTWTQKADFGGSSRVGAVGFSINGKGYAGTGLHNYIQFLKDFWEYDPVTNNWSQKNDFGGTGRDFATGFAIGNKGYIGTGGGISLSLFTDLWEYDPGNDSWVQKKSLPGLPRLDAVGFSLNGKGYIGTGSGLNDMWEYDPASDTWIQKADLPAAGRMDAIAFIICNKAYIGTGGEITLRNDLWEFDPALDQWTRKTDVPGPERDDCPSFSIGNKGYLGLGDAASGLLKDFWEYTPDNGICAGLPKSNFLASDSTPCSNSCINFTDHSTNATAWQWTFPGGLPSSSTAQSPAFICYATEGTYDVTLIASNPGGSDSVTFTNYVNVQAAPPAPVITQAGSVLSCTRDPSYTSYTWFDSNGIIPGATDTFLVITHGGDYTVRVENATGCKTSAGTSIVLGMQYRYNDDGILLSPNPVKDRLHIINRSLSESSDLKIYNMLGQIQCQSVIANRESSISLDGLPAGIYFLRVKSGTQSVVKRFVKE